MKRLPCLLLLAAAAACQSKDPLTLPQLLDPTPFHAPRDQRITTDTQLDTIGIGKPATLRWTVSGFTTFAWALTVPAGSTASLDDPNAAMPTFTPDIEGVYVIMVDATDALGNTEQAQRDLTAAAYLPASDCAQCHPTRAQNVRFTRHGKTVADWGGVLFGVGSNCLTCHVNRNVPKPAMPVPGDFDDAAALSNFDPDNYNWVDFATLANDFPEVAERSAVFCQNCHGPGSQHNSDPRRIDMSLRSEQCGACHNGFVGPDVSTQWGNSDHGKPARIFSSANCRRCHTARAFINWVGDQPAEGEDAGAVGVTCAACHDPHSTNPKNVRLFGTTEIVSGRPQNVGRGAACVRCHQSEVEDAAAHATANGRFPFSVNADMLTAQGAVEYGLTFSTGFHGRTTFRLRPFTGDPADSDTPDACVTCHMATNPGDLLGGHTMALRDGPTEFVTGNCDRCHTGLTTFDRPLGKDFDGDGVAEGAQTETQRLSEVLYQAIAAADSQNGLSRPGGALTMIVVDPDLSRTTPALRQAAYNYNFYIKDGSWGIHNTTYAVQLLQRTYEQVTGRPYQQDFPDADTLP